MLQKINTPFLMLVFSFFCSSAIAQDLHEGDIQPWKIGAEIFVNSTLFEPDFGDIGGGLYTTDDPGFDVNIAKGAFTPGNWLRFQPVGQLLFWNGTEWSAIVPNGERIEITDSLGNAISFRAGGVSDTPAVIGEVGSDGGLHEHLGKISIFDASNALGGSVGAYRIQLKLFESQANSDTSVSIATSPITIVFNRGLEHDKFELAVSAAADLNENSVFVAETGTLDIQQVKALGTYYKVKLRHIGDNKFELIEANEITGIK
ncbi:MAG: hypothetical protein Q7J23_04415 [Nitrosomonas sp.]|uniref:hypothetical protein n=1 Tax=Nitrosomonas sp. TaxID=42353 RepID=UPI00271FCF40|nr:hypothetical protein [Nitrosomonas sp.]MDO9469956.1 hypothetical protein [Nitrosomonas sp.]MDP2223051.1 hypothetical protein [Nitrosomonas sp.]